MGINEKLTDEELKGISGGAGKAIDPKLEKERKEFEKAWERQKKDDLDISGMRRAELFDEWQASGKSAEVFLSNINC